jgi:type IV fimbrial biogenesis protein FimT
MRRIKSTISRREGFTLLEVLVVLIIFGITATMVYPSFSRMSRSTRSNAAANVVMSDLRFFVNSASKNKQVVRLVVDGANRRYTATDRATGAVIRQRSFATSSTNEVAVSTLTSGPNVASLTSAATTIDIFPNGTSSGSLVVRVAVASRTLTVTMTRVGHVRIS